MGIHRQFLNGMLLLAFAPALSTPAEAADLVSNKAKPTKAETQSTLPEAIAPWQFDAPPSESIPNVAPDGSTSVELEVEDNSLPLASQVTAPPLPITASEIRLPPGEAETTQNENPVQLVDLNTGNTLVPASPASALRGEAPSLAQVIGQQQDTGWYVALTPSLVFGYDVNLDSENVTVNVPPLPGFPGGPTTVPLDASINTDTGFGISGAGGYRFDDFRVELEVAYSNSSVSDITVNDNDISSDGSLNSWQFLLNGYYDIPTDSRFSPYIGGGAGLAIFSADDVSATVAPFGEVDLDGSSTSFIFQFKAGVGYDFTDNLNAFVGYRLQGVPGQSFTALDTDFDADTVWINSLQLGARYEF